MNQYEAEAAREWISGYMVSLRPGEAHRDYFERAKDECLMHLQRRVGTVRMMTYEAYIAACQAKRVPAITATSDPLPIP